MINCWNSKKRKVQSVVFVILFFAASSSALPYEAIASETVPSCSSSFQTNIRLDAEPLFLLSESIMEISCRYAEYCDGFHGMGAIAPLPTGGFVLARYGTRLVSQTEQNLQSGHDLLPYHWLVTIDPYGCAATQQTIDWLDETWHIEAVTPSKDQFMLLLSPAREDIWAVALVDKEGNGNIVQQFSANIYIQDTACLPTGGWLLSGSQQINDQRKAWAVLLTPDGSIQWTHIGDNTKIPYPEEHASYAFCWVNNDGLFLFSITWKGDITSNYRLIQLSNEGAILQETPINIGAAIQKGVYPIFAHNQLLIRRVENSGENDLRLELLCFNLSGQLLWQKKIVNTGILIPFSQGYIRISVDPQGYEQNLIFMDTEGRDLDFYNFGGGYQLADLQILEDSDRNPWIFGEVLNKFGFAVKLIFP